MPFVILWLKLFAVLASMVVNKPATFRGRDNSRAAPTIRQAVPDIDHEHMVDKLSKVLDSIGYQNLWEFGAYENMASRECAVVAEALVAMEPLLKAMLEVAPWSEVKYCQMKKVVQDLHCQCPLLLRLPKFRNATSGSAAGDTADKIGTILNHVRRLRHNSVNKN